MTEPNTKHQNFNSEQLLLDKDVFQPEFKRDSRGRYFMQLPGYGKWMVSVEPGSKIISQGSEDEAGGAATDPGSIRTGSLSADTIITVGENVYIDGVNGFIALGNYEKKIGSSMIMSKEGLMGYSGNSLVFAFLLEASGDFEVGDVIIGDYTSDNYILWDDSAGILYIKGDIIIEGDIESANYVANTSGYKLTYATGLAEFQEGLIGGWEIDTCLKKEYDIGGGAKSKIELCPGDPGHFQAAYSPTGSFSLPGDVYMIQVTQGSTGDAGGTPIPRIDIYNDGVKRVMLNSDGLYFFDADGSTVNNKIELTQATLTDVVIEMGALAANSEPSIQGWSHDITFSSTDYNTVAWDGTKTIKLTNGDTFTIDAGNTGNMSAITYIYLDKGTSETVLQTTTTASTAIGSGKILITVAEDNADNTSDATFQVFGGKGGALWIADNIAANTITGNKIRANTIETTELNFTPYVIGTNDLDDIANGTYSKVLTTSITAGQIKLSATLGDLDDIANGTYGKVLTTDISSGHILLSAASGDLDDIANGTYGKVLTTSISAGKILLTSGTGVSGSLPVGNTDADITANNRAQDIVNLPAAPSGSGLFASATYLGFYNGSSWKAYIKNDGKFYFEGNSTHYISWNGSTLTVRGMISVDVLSAINANMGTITAGTFKVSGRINLQKSTGAIIGYLGQDPSASGIWGFIAETGYGLMCRYSGANYGRIFVSGTDFIIDMPSPNKIKIQDNEGNAIGRWYGRNAGFSGRGGLDMFGPIRLYTTASPPSGASNGMMFYHTTWNEVWIYRSGSWQALADKAWVTANFAPI